MQFKILSVILTISCIYSWLCCCWLPKVSAIRSKEQKTPVGVGFSTSVSLIPLWTSRGRWEHEKCPDLKHSREQIFSTGKDEEWQSWVIRDITKVNSLVYVHYKCSLFSFIKLEFKQKCTCLTSRPQASSTLIVKKKYNNSIRISVNFIPFSVVNFNHLLLASDPLKPVIFPLVSADRCEQLKAVKWPCLAAAAAGSSPGTGRLTRRAPENFWMSKMIWLCWD